MPIFRGKTFVSAVSDYKDSVRAGLRSNLNLSAEVSQIDGVTLNDKDRVLLAGQSSAVQNGIYTWSSATNKLTRSDDANSSFELSAGNKVYVEEGNTHAKTTWVLVTAGVITPGNTSIVFSKESQIGTTDVSGTYGTANKALTVTVSDTGKIDSISETEINVDGGTY